LDIGEITSVEMLTRTKKFRSHLAALGDGYLNFWLVVCPNRRILNLSHDQHSVNDPSKHHMFAIEEVALCGSDEELAAIGVLSTVGHGQQARFVVLQLKILISKRGPGVDGHAPSAISIHKVTPLDHEILDHPVELGSFVSKRHTVLLILSSAELSEVLSSLGRGVGIQLHQDPSNLRRSYRHLKEDHRVVWIPQLRLNLVPGGNCRHVLQVFLTSVHISFLVSEEQDKQLVHTAFKNQFEVSCSQQ